jgi:hypothetical protein
VEFLDILDGGHEPEQVAGLVVIGIDRLDGIVSEFELDSVGVWNFDLD